LTVAFPPSEACWEYISTPAIPLDGREKHHIRPEVRFGTAVFGALLHLRDTAIEDGGGQINVCMTSTT